MHGHIKCILTWPCVNYLSSDKNSIRLSMIYKFSLVTRERLINSRLSVQITPLGSSRLSCVYIVRQNTLFNQIWLIPSSSNICSYAEPRPMVDRDNRKYRLLPASALRLLLLLTDIANQLPKANLQSLAILTSYKHLVDEAGSHALLCHCPPTDKMDAEPHQNSFV